MILWRRIVTMSFLVNAKRCWFSLSLDWEQYNNFETIDLSVLVVDIYGLDSRRKIQFLYPLSFKKNRPTITCLLVHLFDICVVIFFFFLVHNLYASVIRRVGIYGKVHYVIGEAKLRIDTLHWNLNYGMWRCNVFVFCEFGTIDVPLFTECTV